MRYKGKKYDPAEKNIKGFYRSADSYMWGNDYFLYASFIWGDQWTLGLFISLIARRISHFAAPTGERWIANLSPFSVSAMR